MSTNENFTFREIFLRDYIQFSYELKSLLNCLKKKIVPWIYVTI